MTLAQNADNGAVHQGITRRWVIAGYGSLAQQPGTPNLGYTGKIREREEGTRSPYLKGLRHCNGAGNGTQKTEKHLVQSLKYVFPRATVYVCRYLYLDL